MVNRRSLYLLTSSLVVVGLIGAPMRAAAQDTAAPAYNDTAAADPPARVGRLAVVQGTVSQHGAGEDHWSPAVLNAPVSAGGAFWTEPQALAELEITSSNVWMDGQTEFDVTTLDDAALHASEPQGQAYLHLRALQQGETFTIETPRGTVTLATDGRYAITAGDTQNPTTVTVLDGAAQITGNNISLQVHANQTASITGDTTFEGSVGPLVQDSFVSSIEQREQPARAERQAAPPVVAQMTGGQDLGAYGAWDTSPEYGNVWYPQVATDWAPYRDGRWSYVAPWGWTWVDAAPWGFAPFHYGRWAQIGPRWGWIPGYPGYAGAYRPVYAPALVSFFGLGVGVGIGVGIGVGYGFGGPAFGSGGRVGWVPLGPREPFYPGYGVSRRYVERVNITNIRNVTNIYNDAGRERNRSIGQYANARAATVVPAGEMAGSRPVRASYRPVNSTDLTGAHALVGRPPIAPNGRTLGLTPRAAQQFRVQPITQSRAPGPQVAPPTRPAAGRPAATPALRAGNGAEHRGAALPLNRPSGNPGPSVPAENAGRPAPSPGLRTPGAPLADRARVGAPGPAIAPPGTAPGATTRPGSLPGLRAPGARPGAPDARVTGPNVSPGTSPRPYPPSHRANQPPPRTPGASQATPQASPSVPRERAQPHAAGNAPARAPALALQRSEPQPRSSPPPARQPLRAPIQREPQAQPQPQRMAPPPRPELQPRPQARPQPQPAPQQAPQQQHPGRPDRRDHPPG